MTKSSVIFHSRVDWQINSDLEFLVGIYPWLSREFFTILFFFLKEDFKFCNMGQAWSTFTVPPR